VQTVGGQGTMMVVMSCTEPGPHTSGGTPADWQAPPMQKFVDKWFLPFLFVAIGSLIAWSLWRR
jgi:hypothetical protein